MGLDLIHVSTIHYSSVLAQLYEFEIITFLFSITKHLIRARKFSMYQELPPPSKSLYPQGKINKQGTKIFFTVLFVIHPVSSNEYHQRYR